MVLKFSNEFVGIKILPSSATKRVPSLLFFRICEVIIIIKLFNCIILDSLEKYPQNSTFFQMNIAYFDI